MSSTSIQSIHSRSKSLRSTYVPFMILKMSNVREVHKTRLNGNNQNMAPMASKSERISCNGNKTSFNTVLENSGRTKIAVHNQFETLAHAFEQRDEASPSAPFQEQDSKLGLPWSCTEPLLNAKLRAATHRMTQKGVKRIYASREQELVVTVADGVLFDVLYVGFGSTSYDFKTASFHLVKWVLPEIAKTGALDWVFDRNIELRTQF